MEVGRILFPERLLNGIGKFTKIIFKIKKLPLRTTLRLLLAEGGFTSVSGSSCFPAVMMTGLTRGLTLAWGMWWAAPSVVLWLS